MTQSFCEDRIKPSADSWLSELKADPAAAQVGMFLTHNGVVRGSARAQVREGKTDTDPVVGLRLGYDREKVLAAIDEAYQLPGIFLIRVWIASGDLRVGDDMMQVMIGGDIRPRVVDCLQFLVGKIKSDCVSEEEQF